MNLRIRPEAQLDIQNAAQWYEDQQSGLGLRLVSEIDAAFERIVSAPAHYAVIYHSFRRSLDRKFPYAIYFAWDEKGVTILAVLHQRRNRAMLDERLDD